MIWASQAGCLGRCEEVFQQISLTNQTKFIQRPCPPSPPPPARTITVNTSWNDDDENRWAAKAASSLSVPSAPDVILQHNRADMKLNTVKWHNWWGDDSPYSARQLCLWHERHAGFRIRCNWSPTPTAPSEYSYVNSWTVHITGPFASPLLPLKMCNTHLRINMKRLVSSLTKENMSLYRRNWRCALCSCKAPSHSHKRQLRS